MNYPTFVELAARNGFALVFALRALWRLDRFLVAFIQHEAAELELLRKVVFSIERLTRTTAKHGQVARKATRA